MTDHAIVSRDHWVTARRRLLTKEKEFLRLRDELSSERRELPWERVDKQYVFGGPAGDESLADLFAGRHQLIVYHFMFAPEWDAGCKSCSFWADNYNGIVPHLNQRDVSLAAISRAPLAKLQAFAARMGWTFKWVSAANTDFNYDYHVSFKPDDVAHGTAPDGMVPILAGSEDGVTVGLRLWIVDPASLPRERATGTANQVQQFLTPQLNRVAIVETVTVLV